MEEIVVLIFGIVVILVGIALGELLQYCVKENTSLKEIVFQ